MPTLSPNVLAFWKYLKMLQTDGKIAICRAYKEQVMREGIFHLSIVVFVKHLVYEEHLCQKKKTCELENIVFKN